MKLPWLRKVGSDLFTARDLRIERRARNETAIRRLCANAYLGDGTGVCRVLGRYKMFVDSTDVGLSPHLMLDGYWEMWLTEALVGCVRRGMTVVDVGANLGYFTMLMADLIGPEGRLLAFEPNPPIAARLRKSLEVNGFDGRAAVHEAPLGDEDGRRLQLIVPASEPKNAHIVAAGSHPDAIELVSRRLDSFPELDQADVVKIDADTSERAIWYGMAGIFERNRKPLTIFLEFTPARYADPEVFLGEIAAAGFSFAEVTLFDGIRPTDIATILEAPATTDQMLMLRRPARP